MIKLVYCITRKPGLDDEEFFRYWKDVHGPLGARIPGLRKLVQSHRIRPTGQDGSAGYDGIAELWFDDLQALEAARHSAEWRTSTEDEKNFIDDSRTALFLTEEHEISVYSLL